MVHIIPRSGQNVRQKEDGLTKLVGHFGKWQFLIFSTVFLVKFSSGWVLMTILFLTPKLKFWCTEFSSNRTELGLNSTCYKDCVKYVYDASPFDNTIVSEWDLVCDRLWLASFTQMALQFGVLIGSVLFGFLSDRYGRKNTFLGSVTLLILFGFGVPYSPNYAVFTTLRFFLGLSVSGSMIISFVIVMETVGVKYREIAGCFFHIPFILGHMSLPLFAYYFRNWNSYTLALAFPSLIYFGYFFILTETPRWLISVGKVEEATKIVRRAAEMNNLPIKKIEETVSTLASEISARNESKSGSNYLDLFRGPLLVRTLCLGAIWIVNGLTYFGLNQYVSQTSDDPFISVAVTAAIQLPSNVIAMVMIKCYGRKITVALACCLGGICVLILGCVPNIFALTLTLGALGICCASIVPTALYIYSSELYPTVVRNMSLGALSMAFRIGSMVAPFISNLSVVALWLPTVIFGFAPIFVALLCLWLPETKGTVLPDSMEDVKNTH